MLDAIFSRARLILTLLVFVIISGVITYVVIPKENNPDIEIPIIYVSMSLAGISPQDSERLLVRPVESELSDIAGVEKKTSAAYQGGGNVLLRFAVGYDLKKAYSDVKRAVDRAKQKLPSDAELPQIHEVNLNDEPIIIANLSGSVDDAVLIRIARKLKRAYQKIPGVLDVSISGDREESVEILLKPEVLELYNITPTQVASVFALSNRLIAAGQQRGKEKGAFNIKVPGTFETVKDILDLPIVQNGDRYIRVRDVANYSVKFKEPTTISRFNGNTVISLGITKHSGKNLIDTVAKIRSVTESAKKLLPANVKLNLGYDTSTEIQSMLLNLQNSILSAVVLIMIIVVAALGLRSGIIIGIAIPCSFLTGIMILYALGLSMNSVVLFGLILSVGLLVDGAIVITEYAERKRSEGIDVMESYKMAVRKMGFPIISSTATTLAAFLPLLFWPGIVGKFMMYVPLTLICILTVSLIVALVVIPVLGINFKVFFSIILRILLPILSANILFAPFGMYGAVAGIFIGIVLGHYLVVWYKNMKYTHDRSYESQAALIASSPIAEFDGLKGLTRKYYGILRFVLQRPKKILFAAGVMLIFSWVAYFSFGKGVEFFPSSEPSTFSIKVYSPGNLSLAEKDAMVKSVEKILFDMNATMRDFKSVNTTVSSGSSSRAKRNDKIASINIELVEWDKRRHFDIIKQDLTTQFSKLKGMQVRISGLSRGPRNTKPIDISVTGLSRKDIRKSVVNIKKAMLDMKVFRDINDTLGTNNVEFNYIPNRQKAATYGVSMQTLGQTIRLVTTGVKAGSFRPDFSEEEVDIIVRYPKKYRTLSGIEGLKVQTKNGAIPLSNIVTTKVTRETPVLKRENEQPVHSIDANVVEGVIANNALQDLLKVIKQKDLLVNSSSLILSGDKKDQEDSKQFLFKAFAIALILMATILLMQFNSFYSAFLILFAIILSTVGVMIGLLLSNQAFSIVMSGISIIALAGIVVNNNIVLIDTFNERRKTENSVYDAVVRTAIVRLRPVLLTSGTTGLGLLPTALGISTDFVSRSVTIDAPSVQIWELLSQNILFGLIFSSILTLVITPCALYVFYARKEKQ